MNNNIEKLLHERGGRYGAFPKQAHLAQAFKGLMRNSQNYERMHVAQREALDAIAFKLSRILTGDPNYEDSWLDIVGYAALVVEFLNKQDVQAGQGVS